MRFYKREVAASGFFAAGESAGAAAAWCRILCCRRGSGRGQAGGRCPSRPPYLSLPRSLLAGGSQSGRSNDHPFGGWRGLPREAGNILPRVADAAISILKWMAYSSQENCWGDLCCRCITVWRWATILRTIIGQLFRQHRHEQRNTSPMS